MRILFVAIFCLLFNSKTPAQDFQHLTVEDGLSNSTVYSIRQYYKGMIWLSTKLGIDRFDGTSFKHYNLYETGNLLHFGHRNTKLHTDDYDRLWATNIRDIFRYDKNTDDFKLILSLNEGYIIHDFLIADSLNILLATNKGLVRFNTATKSIHPYKELSHQILKVAVYDKHIIVISAGDSIIAFDYKKSATRPDIFHSSLGGSKNITTLAVDLHKNIFAGYDGKVFLFQNSRPTPITSNSLNRLFNNSAIRKILPYSSDAIYIATDGAGAYIVNHKLELKKIIKADQDNPKAIPDNSISDIIIDDASRVWLSGIGVSFYDSNRTPFQFYQHELNNRNSLIHNTVKAIAEGSNGDLWIGTNHGISVLNRKEKQWTHLTQSSTQGRLPTNKILHMSPIPGIGMAAGTYQNGLIIIKTDKIERLSIEKSVHSIKTDSMGVWIGGATGKGGLERINFETGQNSSYPLNYIFSITEHPRGGIITGGHEGLYIISSQGKIKSYGATDYQTGSIFCVLVDRKGRIWCATEGQGLLRFHEEEQRFTKYTTADGLPANMLYGLLEDKLGRIWISTTNGLSCFDPDEQQFYNFGAGDHGIKEFSYGARALLSTGEMAFGGRNGFIVFHPENIIPKEIETPLVFTNLKLFNKPANAGKTGSPLTKTLDLTDTLVLNYNQNALSLDFISVEISNPSETSYSWKLEGLDQEWTPPGNERTANYTNLKPGQYLFKVKSLSNRNMAETAERTLNIIVLPPIWLTGWAFLAYFLIAGLVVYIIFRIYHIRLNEIHARDKISFFVNLAHDIRTPLSLIISPLSLALERNDFSKQTRDAIKTANHNGKRLSQIINQLLDFEKIALNKVKLDLTSVQVEEVLDELCQNFIPSMEEKSISFTRNFQQNNTVVCLDRDKFDRIIFNLLSNAVKYTDEGGQISVCTFIKNKQFTVLIRDTGIGIPKEQHTYIFEHYYRATNAINSNEVGSGIGLLLTKKLVELHNGELSFESEAGRGSVFSVSLPITSQCLEKVEKEVPYVSEFGELAALGMKEKKPKLLIAEDHKELLKHLIENLDAHYHIYQASNGREALDLTKKVFPDIVVSDVMMPEMNGNQLCYELKNHIETSHIPVILLTSLTSDENKIDGIKTGADIYMEKPFDLELLKASIEGLLRNRERLKDKFLRKENITDDDGLNELDRIFIEKAENIIERNLSNSDFSIDVFEREMGISHAGMYRKFKSIMGKTPLGFIQEIRLKKAIEMISTGNYQVNEVAYAVGYSDPKYFSTVFKKHFGENASEYLPRNQKV